MLENKNIRIIKNNNIDWLKGKRLEFKKQRINIVDGTKITPLSTLTFVKIFLTETR